MAERTTTAELELNTGPMVCLGRSPAECEAGGEVAVGQRNKRRTHPNAGVITTSFPTLLTTAAPVFGGECR